MRLYLITPKGGFHYGYDTFDSAIVVAKSKAAAVKIHPKAVWGPYDDPWDHCSGAWPASPDLVDAECIGTANKKQKEGEVICASFNVG